jgi:hypothetical protein
MVPQWDRSVNAGLIEAFESLPFGPERLLETMVLGSHSWAPRNATFQLGALCLTAPPTPCRSSFTSFTERLDLHQQARINFYTCRLYGR